MGVSPSILSWKIERGIDGQNHLIETASPTTGSMLIWDTGEYEILPYQPEPTQPETDDSQSEVSDASQQAADQRIQSEKLREAFQFVCLSATCICRANLGHSGRLGCGYMERVFRRTIPSFYGSTEPQTLRGRLIILRRSDVGGCRRVGL